MNIASRTALVFALTTAATFAHGAGLVANGDFETGSLSGWTQSGNTDSFGTDPFAAHSGAIGAFFGPESTGTLSQTLATTAGTTYKVDFWLSLQDSATPNIFSWSWGNAVQSPSLNNAAGSPYTEYTSFVTATGASTALSFSFTNPNSFWLFDDVSVTAVTAPVPEPETYALLAGGLLALLGRRRLARRAR